METVFMRTLSIQDAVSEEDRRQALKEGRQRLQRVIDFHNRGASCHMAKILLRLMWPVAIPLALAGLSLFLGGRAACVPGEFPAAETIEELYQSAWTFEEWGKKLERRSHAHAASGVVRVRYSHVADFGVTYTRQYRECLHKYVKKSCARQLTRLHLVQPEGLLDSVLLMNARDSHQLAGEATCMLRRTSPMLYNLEVESFVENNGKKMRGIGRGASRSEAGNKYIFDADSKLLPIAANCVVEGVPASRASCVLVGDRGLIMFLVALALLFLLPKHGLRGLWQLQKCGVLPVRTDCDKVLCALASQYTKIFDKTLSVEDVCRLILEDVGLSHRFNVLFEEPGALLSQNWVFASGFKPLAAGIHILTSCERIDCEWLLCDPIVEVKDEPLPEATGQRLSNRLGDDTWLDFQVLRQIDLRLFKTTADGHVLRVNPLTFMPELPSGSDWADLRECSTTDGVSLEESLQNGGGKRDGLTRAISDSTLTAWESPVQCSVSQDTAHCFIVSGKQTFSWRSLRTYVSGCGHRKSDTLVAHGPGEGQRAFVQTDPFKVTIYKSNKVDFGLEPPKLGSLGGLDGLDGIQDGLEAMMPMISNMTQLFLGQMDQHMRRGDTRMTDLFEGIFNQVDSDLAQDDFFDHIVRQRR